jgi:hypothetical protein
VNKRKNAAERKHRHTAQKVKARKKGIDPALDRLWQVGPWEERRSRSWRSQRTSGEGGEATTTSARRGRARSQP